jgi:crossover junction endodeoxyribonuclease RuvC
MPASSTLHQRRALPPGPTPHGSRSSPLVLGIDPGLHHTGYGALQLKDGHPHICEAGVLSTRAGAGFGDRLRHLHRDVERLLDDLRPDVIVLEGLFVHGRFPRTAIVLGHARGIIYLAAAGAGVGVMELPPSVVKRAVAGTGRASKAQMQAAMQTVLGVRRLADAHAADALALAYAGLNRVARHADRQAGGGMG